MGGRAEAAERLVGEAERPDEEAERLVEAVEKRVGEAERPEDEADPLSARGLWEDPFVPLRVAMREIGGAIRSWEMESWGRAEAGSLGALGLVALGPEFDMRLGSVCVVTLPPSTLVPGVERCRNSARASSSTMSAT